MNDPIYCPYCDADTGIVRCLSVREEVTCPDCGQEFEAANVDPLEMVPTDPDDGDAEGDDPDDPDDPDDLDDADDWDWEDDLED